MMESPDEASEMESPMVVQGVVGDKQLFVSFPDAPFTYHVVVARAIGAWVRNRAVVKKTELQEPVFMSVSSEPKDLWLLLAQSP